MYPGLPEFQISISPGFTTELFRSAILQKTNLFGMFSLSEYTGKTSFSCVERRKQLNLFEYVIARKSAIRFGNN
jgi:hypothetical protein